MSICSYFVARLFTVSFVCFTLCSPPLKFEVPWVKHLALFSIYRHAVNEPIKSHYWKDCLDSSGFSPQVYTELNSDIRLHP